MAEDVVQVLPFNAPVGLTENDFDEEHVMQLYMTNTNAYTAMQLDLYLPEGLSLQLDEQAWDFNPDRFDGITKRGVFNPYHDIDISKKDDVPGHYLLLLYDTDLSIIKENDGVLIDFYYLTSEDVQPGIYPITVSGTVLTVDSHNDVRPATSVSYVKIGEPEANVVYNLGDGIVPSFVESELNSLTNVVVNGACQNLVLVDGHDAVIPCDFTAASASYSRTMGTTWGTICLPYTVTSDENVAYYQITGVENDMLTLTKYDELPAGTPALVKKLAGDGIAPQATSVAVSGEINNVAGSVNMFGSYTNQTRIEDPNSYYIYNDKFYSCNEYFFCNAFRAYFIMEGAGAKVLTIAGDDVVTAINALTGENCGVNVEAVYSEDGVLRNDLEAGMNIVKFSNGKTQKVIIK